VLLLACCSCPSCIALYIDASIAKFVASCLDFVASIFLLLHYTFCGKDYRHGDDCCICSYIDVSIEPLVAISMDLVSRIAWRVLRIFDDTQRHHFCDVVVCQNTCVCIGSSNVGICENWKDLVVEPFYDIYARRHGGVLLFLEISCVDVDVVVFVFAVAWLYLLEHLLHGNLPCIDEPLVDLFAQMTNNPEHMDLQIPVMVASGQEAVPWALPGLDSKGPLLKVVKAAFSSLKRG